ncbi:hypothetical protein U0070_011470 [Myodes glareolus]|uniref:Uncharacterized protein n=1 Tax=Myodes glareolus TaxID=447135 RepID=A0AAW0HKA3_MYOGA
MKRSWGNIEQIDNPKVKPGRDRTDNGKLQKANSWLNGLQAQGPEFDSLNPCKNARGRGVRRGKAEDKEWILITKLGRLAKDVKIKSLEQSLLLLVYFVNMMQASSIREEKPQETVANQESMQSSASSQGVKELPGSSMDQRGIIQKLLETDTDPQSSIRWSSGNPAEEGTKDSTFLDEVQADLKPEIFLLSTMFNNMPNLTDEESGGGGRDDSCSKPKSPGDAHEEARMLGTCISLSLIKTSGYLGHPLDCANDDDQNHPKVSSQWSKQQPSLHRTHLRTKVLDASAPVTERVRQRVLCGYVSSVLRLGAVHHGDDGNAQTHTLRYHALKSQMQKNQKFKVIICYLFSGNDQSGPTQEKVKEYLTSAICLLLELLSDSSQSLSP